MKILTILTLVTLTMSVYSQSNGCGENCLDCAEGVCNTCYKSSLRDGVCDTTTTLPTGCVATGLNDMSGEVACSQCDVNFLLEPFTGTCVPGGIEGCVLGFTVFGQSKCIVCDGFFPDEESTSCTIKLEDDLCVWGSRGDDIGAGCFRCKKGYTSMGGKCAEEKIEGCMMSEDEGATCRVCDFENNYFAQLNNLSCQLQE